MYSLKKLIAVCYFLFAVTIIVAAQDSKYIRKKIANGFTEVYQVNNGNKKIKNGIYAVLNENNRVLVQGKFINNKKDSIWTYYNILGNAIQQYDFTNNKIIIDLVDTTTIVHSKFQLIGVNDSTGIIEPPHKIGGAHYGFFLLYDERQVPQEARNETFRSKNKMIYTFHISETGKLTGWDITINGESISNDKPVSQSTQTLPSDAYEFTAAKVNGKAVKSKLMLYVDLNVSRFSSPEGFNNEMKSSKD